MQPDASRSAFYFTALAEDLARYGWLVEALPARTTGSGSGRRVAKRESRGLVRYRRIRLRSAKDTTRGRRFGINTRMILAWAGLALRPASRRPDVVLIGSEPAYGLLAGWLIKLLCPNIRVAHWRLTFEADALAGRPGLEENRFRVRLRKALLKHAQNACDLIAETNPHEIVACGSDLGKAAAPRQVMILPWLPDAPDPPEAASPVLVSLLRQALFGSARIGVLCLMETGKGAAAAPFLALARALEGHHDIGFCLAFDPAAAAEAEQLADAAGPGLRLAPLTDLHAPLTYLSASDIHFMSSCAVTRAPCLDEGLLASLAAARPVLLAGPADGEAGRWIARTRTGWVMTPENFEAVAAMLTGFARAPEELEATAQRCRDLYDGRVRRIDATAHWQAALSALAGDDWFSRPAFQDTSPFMNLSHPRLAGAGQPGR